MSDYKDTVSRLPADVVERFKTALETGKWPDGQVLSEEQKAQCMEAVLIYEAQHKSPQEQTGYIDRGSKAEGELCGDHDHADDEQTIKWQH